MADTFRCASPYFFSNLCRHHSHSANPPRYQGSAILTANVIELVTRHFTQALDEALADTDWTGKASAAESLLRPFTASAGMRMSQETFA